MSRRGPAGVSLGTVLVVAISLAGLVSGCGLAATSSPPTGIDGLVVPTPSPRPADFVATVDNPLFPLPDGASWVYDVDDVRGGRPAAGTATRTAGPGPTVDGIATTTLRTVLREHTDRRRLAPLVTTDLYAQDAAGNVWWFGHEGPDEQWRVGDGDVRAGLAVPAHPRLGDGFWLALGSAVGVRAEVVSVQATSSVDAGSFDAELALDVTDRTASPPTDVRLFYAPGVGLVQLQDVLGAAAPSWRLRSSTLSG